MARSTAPGRARQRVDCGDGRGVARPGDRRPSPGAAPFATNDLGYLKGTPWLADLLAASDRAVLEGRYAAVVLPRFLVDAYRDELAPRYRFERWVGPRDRPVGVRHTDLVGWRTYPYAVFLRLP